jgi:hypothetical protein
MIIQTSYAGLNFSSRNLFDSAAGGTFMSITLGAATNLLDNMMVNYSEWHTERVPQGKKVNSVEETSSLRDKIDTIMSMLVSSRAHVYPNIYRSFQKTEEEKEGGHGPATPWGDAASPWPAPPYG